jgi:N-sulfoglucosamine sulfohydrolase
MKRILLATLALFSVTAAAHASERPNILIITVDDMSADSIGAFGCALPDTTPTIDRLAAEGLRFEHAHVQAANCMPSRNVMWSGRYPHNNRVEGFYQVRDPDYPVLTDLMKAAGYFTAIRGKASHSTPYFPYAWDLVLDTLPDGGRAHAKDVDSYKTSAEQGIRAAQQADKPFCLMINVSDPHKPFYGQGGRGRDVADPHVPSRVFTPEETPVPGFLFDDPVVRKELSHYYSTVRRADDCVAGVLEALDASGEAENTIVVFLSDHGMPLPFAKTQLYHHSTRTPLAVRWPGVTSAGAVDKRHMVSAVDLLPTLLDVAGFAHPDGLDGRSFAPLLRGETQDDREHAFKAYNENSGGSRDPMRAVQTQRFLYIFNAWSNGERVMKTATQGTPTYRRMKELAASDPEIAARLELLDHRVVEELYDTAADPDCLQNLIDDPAYESELAKLRSLLEAEMARTGDPMLEVFRRRYDVAAREAYVTRVEKESTQRGQRKKARDQRRAAAGRPKRGARGAAR